MVSSNPVATRKLPDAEKMFEKHVQTICLAHNVMHGPKYNHQNSDARTNETGLLGLVEPPRPADLADAGRDVVILSGDRRTLSVDLSAGTAIDQIRVIAGE
jgi:hypothetical protein